MEKITWEKYLEKIESSSFTKSDLIKFRKDPERKWESEATLKVKSDNQLDIQEKIQISD